MASQLTSRQWIFMLVLSIAMFVFWKLGVPAASPSTAQPATSASAAVKAEGKQCCEKPVNRAALMKQAAKTPTPSETPADPTAPVPAASPVTEPAAPSSSR